MRRTSSGCGVRAPGARDRSGRPCRLHGRRRVRDHDRGSGARHVREPQRHDEPSPRGRATAGRVDRCRSPEDPQTQRSRRRPSPRGRRPAPAEPDRSMPCRRSREKINSTAMIGEMTSNRFGVDDPVRRPRVRARPPSACAPRASRRRSRGDGAPCRERSRAAGRPPRSSYPEPRGRGPRARGA